MPLSNRHVWLPTGSCGDIRWLPWLLRLDGSGWLVIPGNAQGCFGDGSWSLIVMFVEQGRSTTTSNGNFLWMSRLGHPGRTIGIQQRQYQPIMNHHSPPDSTILFNHLIQPPYQPSSVTHEPIINHSSACINPPQPALVLTVLWGHAPWPRRARAQPAPSCHCRGRRAPGPNRLQGSRDFGVLGNDQDKYCGY